MDPFYLVIWRHKINEILKCATWNSGYQPSKTDHFMCLCSTSDCRFFLMTTVQYPRTSLRFGHELQNPWLTPWCICLLFPKIPWISIWNFSVLQFATDQRQIDKQTETNLSKKKFNHLFLQWCSNIYIKDWKVKKGNNWSVINHEIIQLYAEKWTRLE